MSVKKFLTESLANNENKFVGFSDVDFINETEEINEGKKNYDNFTLEQVKELSKDDVFSNSNRFSEIVYPKEKSYAEGTVWYKNWKIRKYRGSIQFTDVSDAMKRGKEVPYTAIYANFGQDSFNVALLNYVSSIKKAMTLEEFMSTILKSLLESGETLFLKEDGTVVDGSSEADVSIEAYYDKNKTKGVSTYAPHIVPLIKPIKVFPKKWKVADLIKVVATNQYTYLGRDYHYTDDYTYDAAYNYGKTDKLNPIDLIKKFIENPNWYTSIWNKGGVATDVEGKITTLNFGSSNENFTIVVNIDNPLTTAAGVVKRFK